MNIVIVGAGEVGKHLAQSLSTQLHNIVIIEQSEALAAELNEKLDVSILCSSGTAATTLAEANVAEADLFLGLTSDDNTNLVAASLAKAMGAKRTVARVHASIQREQWLFNYQQHFGIDYLFSTERLAAVEINKHLRNPDALAVEEIARGRIELQQIRVSKESTLIDIPFHTLPFPKRVRIACIERDGNIIIPGGNDHLAGDDIVTVFGEPHHLDDFIATLTAITRKKDELKVLIFGGDEYAFALAQMFESEPYQVRIMEKDSGQCRKLAETLQDTVIINGDPTSLQQLKEEQIGNVDFFIATCPDDEDNVMACLQAKSLGTDHCLTLIHRADYADVVSRNRQRLGMLGAVSPRLTATRDLLRFIETEDYHVVVNLRGEVRVLQFTLADSAKVIGKKISEISWPHGSALVAIIRGEEAHVPRGEDILTENDVVYAIVSAQGSKPLKKLLNP